MSSTLSKVLSIFLYVLLGVSALSMIILFKESSALQSDAGTAANLEALGGTLEFAMQWTYILLGASVVGAVLFAIAQIFLNFNKSKKSLYGIIGLVVVILVARGLATDEVVKMFNWEVFYGKMYPGLEGEAFTDQLMSLSKSVGTGLKTVYILGILAVLGIISSPFLKAK